MSLLRASKPVVTIEVTPNTPTTVPFSWEDSAGDPVAAPVAASLWLGGDLAQGADTSDAVEIEGVLVDASTFEFLLPALKRATAARLVADGAMVGGVSVVPAVAPGAGAASPSVVMHAGSRSVRISVGADGMARLVADAVDELPEPDDSWTTRADMASTPGKLFIVRRHYLSTTPALLIGTTAPTTLGTCAMAELPPGYFLRFFCHGILLNAVGSGQSLTLGVAVGASTATSLVSGIPAGQWLVALDGWLSTVGGAIRATVAATSDLTRTAAFAEIPTGTSAALSATLGSAGLALAMSPLTVVPSLS